MVVYRPTLASETTVRLPTTLPTSKRARSDFMMPFLRARNPARAGCESAAVED
jgi:hypothetical protein